VRNWLPILLKFDKLMCHWKQKLIVRKFPQVDYIDRDLCVEYIYCASTRRRSAICKLLRRLSPLELEVCLGGSRIRQNEWRVSSSFFLALFYHRFEISLNLTFTETDARPDYR
jgi:hypothetical protein